MELKKRRSQTRIERKLKGECPGTVCQTLELYDQMTLRVESACRFKIDEKKEFTH